MPRKEHNPSMGLREEEEVVEGNPVGYLGDCRSDSFWNCVEKRLRVCTQNQTDELMNGLKVRCHGMCKFSSHFQRDLVRKKRKYRIQWLQSL